VDWLQCFLTFRPSNSSESWTPAALKRYGIASHVGRSKQASKPLRYDNDCAHRWQWLYSWLYCIADEALADLLALNVFFFCYRL
jgi:hypothetical protein